jgi:hypothetical protein
MGQGASSQPELVFIFSHNPAIACRFTVKEITRTALALTSSFVLALVLGGCMASRSTSQDRLIDEQGNIATNQGPIPGSPEASRQRTEAISGLAGRQDTTFNCKTGSVACIKRAQRKCPEHMVMIASINRADNLTQFSVLAEGAQISDATIMRRPTVVVCGNPVR